MHNKQQKSIVIHGPQGSGKTRHGEALRKHFGLAKVVEAEDIKRPPMTGALILTHLTPSPDVRRQLHIDEALQILKTKPAGYPFK